MLLNTNHIKPISSHIRFKSSLSSTIKETAHGQFSDRDAYPFQIDRIALRIILVVSELHDEVIKWKHFPRYWPFVRGIHRSTVNSPHKGQWRGALMFFLICVWMNGWVNNREAGDLRRYRAHYDVIVMAHTAWYASKTSGNKNLKADTRGHPFRRRYFQMNDNFCILMMISLKFVLNSPNDNKSLLI